jgi:hypothetical protein
MNEFNPYAAPKEQSLAYSGDIDVAGAWCDGNLLVVTKGYDLPDRCLKCNEPAGGWRLKRTFSWHPPILYVLIIASLLIYVIVALIVRHTGKLAVPLCPRHRQIRRQAIIVGWLSSLLGLAVMIASVVPRETNPILLILGAGLLLFGILYGLLRSQTVVPSKIDKQRIWLRKVDPEFLAELPPYEWEDDPRGTAKRGRISY